jgi:drug/metabolite transporter (DMT)-like permease
VIISLAVVITPLVEGIWSRRWLPRGFFVAVAVTCAGLVGLVLSAGAGGGGYPLIGEWGAGQGLGDVLILSAAFVRGVHVAAIGQLTRGRSFDSVRVTTIQAMVCLAALTLVAPGSTWSGAAHFSAVTWAGIVYLGLICGVFAFLVQILAVRRTSASRASLLLGTEPVWAVVIGLALGHEHLAPLGWCAVALVIGATSWAQRIERAARQAGAPATVEQAQRPRDQAEPGRQGVEPQAVPVEVGSIEPAVLRAEPQPQEDVFPLDVEEHQARTRERRDR